MWWRAQQQWSMLVSGPGCGAAAAPNNSSPAADLHMPTYITPLSMVSSTDIVPPMEATPNRRYILNARNVACFALVFE